MNWRKPLLRIMLDLKDTLLGARSATTRCYDEILALESAGRKAIEACQQQRLEDLLLHSHLHVPYYRGVLEECGAVREGRVHMDRFTQIPFLTKDLIRERHGDFISDDCGKRHVYRNSSGGSTGEPVDLFQDNLYRSMNWATVLYYNHALGKELGEREAKLWGSERDILKGSIGIKAMTENFLYNRLLLNGFRMTQDNFREYVARINRFRPRSLWTYVDSIHQLACFIERENQKVFPIPITITTAGTLTQEVRDYVERVMGTQVYNQYGSREVGPIAADCCKQEGLHLFEWSQVVEVLGADGKPASDGESGEVVVTLLCNYSMPLIRYRIGDMAVAADRFCSCGRPTRLLKAVTGRITDHFIRKDGTLVHGEYFTHIYYHRSWVRRFQVVQEDYDRIVNNLVVTQQPGIEEEREIERLIHAVMGNRCRVDFRYVDRIVPSASGKYLYTISNVKSGDPPAERGLS